MERAAPTPTVFVLAQNLLGRWGVQQLRAKSLERGVENGYVAVRGKIVLGSVGARKCDRISPFLRKILVDNGLRLHLVGAGLK